jgi:hypothetical protein
LGQEFVAALYEAIAEDKNSHFLLSKALNEPLRRIIFDATLRKQMGEKAKQRVESIFDQKDMIEAVVKNRFKLISNRHSKRPI